MCDPQLTLEMAEYMSQIGTEGLKGIPNSTATKDFAIISEKIPTTYMILTAGFMYDRGDYPLHHPNAQFDENVCVIGAACFFERHLLYVVSKKTAYNHFTILLILNIILARL